MQLPSKNLGHTFEYMNVCNCTFGWSSIFSWLTVLLYQDLKVTWIEIFREPSRKLQNNIFYATLRLQWDFHTFLNLQGHNKCHAQLLIAKTTFPICLKFCRRQTSGNRWWTPITQAYAFGLIPSLHSYLMDDLIVFMLVPHSELGYKLNTSVVQFQQQD